MPIKVNRLNQGFSFVSISESDFLLRKSQGKLEAKTVYRIANRLYVRTTANESMFVGLLEHVASLPETPKADRLYYNVTTEELAVYNGTEWEKTAVPSFSLYQTAESEQFTAVIGDGAEGGVTAESILNLLQAHINNSYVHLPTGGAVGQVLTRGVGGTWEWIDYPADVGEALRRIEIALSLLSGGSLTMTCIAAATGIVYGTPVGIDTSGRVVPVTSDSADEVKRYIGLAVNETLASVGGSVLVQMLGAVTRNDWDWAPGLPVYLNTGTPSLTQIDPTTSPDFSYHQEIGIALSAKTVLLRRSNAVMLK
jgi:hypothetical protein